MSAASQRSRLEGLDALRGIAALSVVLYHYGVWHFEPPQAGLYAGRTIFWLPYGRFGVELFFIISGFVIFMTLQRTTSLYQFLTARFARLYPAFLVSLLATLAITTALPAAPAGLTLGRILANLSMVAQLFDQTDIDGSYWTLRYELDFYVLAALAFLVLRWRAPELPCAVWIGIELAVRLGLGATPLERSMQLTHTSFAHLFVIGIMLYRLHAGQVTLLTLPVLAFALSLSLFGSLWAPASMSHLEYAVLVAGFALAVWLATTRFSRPLRIAPLRFLGRVSYPLYLVHQAAGCAVISRLESAGLNPNIAMLVTVILAIALAWAISTTVEWPMYAWLRARFAAVAVQFRVRLVQPSP